MFLVLGLKFEVLQGSYDIVESGSRRGRGEDGISVIAFLADVAA